MAHTEMHYTVSVHRIPSNSSSKIEIYIFKKKKQKKNNQQNNPTKPTMMFYFLNPPLPVLCEMLPDVADSIVEAHLQDERVPFLVLDSQCSELARGRPTLLINGKSETRHTTLTTTFMDITKAECARVM